MQKKLLVQSSVIAGLCLAVFCSKNPFDSSTDLGRQIVNDHNPAITDINGNFKSYLGKANLSGYASVRDPADSIPSGFHKNPYFLFAGVSGGLPISASKFYDTAVSYMEFRTGAFQRNGLGDLLTELQTAFRDDLDTNKKSPKARIDSIVFVINRSRITVDSAAPSRRAAIDLFSCQTMKDSALFDPARLQKRIHSFSVSLDSAGSGTEDDSTFRVRLDSTYKTLLWNAIKAVDDTVLDHARQDTSQFAFALKPNSDSSSHGIVRFNYYADFPKIAIYYHLAQDDNNSASRSQNFYPEFSFFSVFESSRGTSSQESPVSTWEAARRGLIKLDFTPLDSFMKNTAPDGKKYVIIQRADMDLRVSKIYSDLAMDSIKVNFTVSDSQAVSDNSFNIVDSFYVKANAGPDTSYVLSLARWIQSPIVKSHHTQLYLYLTIPTQGHWISSSLVSPSNIQIDWTQPAPQLKLNAIVTNPR
jgi:hypothetical protein